MSEAISSSSSKPDSRSELSVDQNQGPTTVHQRHRETWDGEDQEKPDTEEPGRIRAVPIHQRPDLLVPCADLVNSEWQRSQAARVHSLQKSCSEFPVCLVLLQGERGSERLLGHVRLTRVVSHSSGLFVESVVVSKEERGKGYGRILMEETERYAKRRGFKRLSLTTHDKQHFYAHLGYVLSTPVQSSGAVMALVPMAMLMKISSVPSGEQSCKNKTVSKMDVSGGADVSSPSASLQTPPPPPPPPPPPIHPPPPPPPIHPPPPPPQSAGQLQTQTLTKTPYRDIKGVPIFWMHKDI
nr:N-alpha-acetyltransferase 80 isoform X2 [Nothobranchius furzeri]